MSINDLRIPLEIIKVATNDFCYENLIGRGGSGNVYRGRLLHRGKLIHSAIKRFRSNYENSDFEVWFKGLSSIKHENIVSIIGFCDEGGEKIFITEYAVNGSLDKYLSDPWLLTWMQRLKICVGVARALTYIHDNRRSSYYAYAAIKSSNVLLGENWEAKIFTSGVSNFLSEKRHRDQSRKYDVYSFGVILFQVLYGRGPKNDTTTKWSLNRLPFFRRDEYKKGKLEEMIDPDLRLQMEPQSMAIFSETAYHCLERQRSQRPDIKKVVESLERALKLQLNHEYPSNDLRIPLKDIKVATNNFSFENLIGRYKRYGNVYTGQLFHSGRLINTAIKRFNRDHLGDCMFWLEIKEHSYLKHENLVSIIGFCDEGDEKIVITEYAVHGSLDEYLSDPSSLTWMQRLTICVGVARALSYIHDNTWQRRDGVTGIHGNIKSSNVLLQENWEAKVCDFALSSASQRGNILIDDIIETMEYTDPTYQETGILTRESDVYSFGVVLFQVLCGTAANVDGGYEYLVPKAIHHYEERKLDQMIDPILRDQINPQSMAIFSDTAYNCLKTETTQRPDMKKIVESLQRALVLQQIHEDPFLDYSKRAIITQDMIKQLLILVELADEPLKITFENLHQGYPAEAAIRFLKARDGNISKAHKMLVNCLKWRIENEIDNILKKPIVPDALYRSVRESQLIGMSGYTNDGRPVIAVGVGLSAYDKKSTPFYVKSHIQINEYRDRVILPYATKKLKQHINTCVKVLDMTGLKLSHLHQIKLLTVICSVDDLNYPEKTDTYYIVNAPYVFSACWKVVRPLLQERTRKKVLVLQGCGKDELLKIMNHESLPHFCRRQGSGSKHYSRNSTDDDYCFSLDHRFHQKLYNYIKRQSAGVKSRDPIKQGSFVVGFPEPDSTDYYPLSSHEEFAHLKIRLEDIEKATNNFSDENLIGKGGFGKVYKGTLLWSGKLTSIAARRLHYDYGQGDHEFWNEISMLSTLKHRNIVSFIGYCNENDEKIIIYEYEYKESLDKYLKDPTLTWMKRLEICVGVAKALNYIHCDDGHDSSVIHSNIKSSKIVLDEKWKPKLSGFEHSKKNTKARRHRLVLAEIVGTIGYVDPTYEKTGFVTHKSDVFSFGVVLFEVLCGRKAFVPDEKEKHSPQFAKPDSKVEDQLDILENQPDKADQPFTKGKLPSSNLAPSFSESWNPFRRVKPVRQSSSFVERRPSSFVDRKPSSFVDRHSFGGYGQSSSKNSSSVNQLNYKERNDGGFTMNKSVWSPTDTLPAESSSRNQPLLLEPLFTMKRLEQYLHSPNDELLAQLARSHYDEESLDDIIDPALRAQMDPQSYKIFSETAYNCLKEHRAQRPNIDHILRNLEKALEHQTRLENPEQSKVAAEVEGTSSYLWEEKHLEHLKIPLTDIELATEKFTKIYLGSGAYGKVYGAELDLPIEKNKKGDISKKRRNVAIKCITKDKLGEEGFIAEIELLTRCKHDNIISLLGFCVDGRDYILVYERVTNGSLDDYLGITDKSTYITWSQRLKICTDIARGLNYLHTRIEDEQSIIHRDIKSGNILLGKNWVAKIADFGLSRFHYANQQEKTRYSKNIAGTEVYMCPEYRKEGKLKRAIDIYSFGVVLFEILSGKLAYDEIYTQENEYGIAHVARRRFIEGTLNEMVDSNIMEEVDELTSTLNKGPNQDSLRIFIAIAHRCVAETQNERPTAQQVLEELEKASSCQENKKDNLQMSFNEINSATRGFSHKNMIGGGGFGRVYKGEVTRGIECNTIVAKRLDRRQGQGDHQFLMELEILFEYKHENIIRLEGYCNEKNEKIIVYEYASKISLDGHLKDDSLTWTKRLSICIDVARGLAFLHGGALTKEAVIHRDIKCANILLNGDWKAKISDFGLSAITAVNQKVISSVVGTDGYVDPLYAITGFCTEKSDIYSFGVVLFEILYGQLLVPNTENYDKHQIITTLEQIHDEGKLDLIVFEGIKKQIAPESLSTFRMLVSRCLQLNRDSRPTACEILEQLNKAMENQEDYEKWKPKLPEDYEEILKKSEYSAIYSTETKKFLYNMFSKGILLQDEKLWFSLGNTGKRNEMISAIKFSYRSRSPHKWVFVTESRFQKVAEMLDISNLMIKIKTKTKYLSPGVLYGVYLVFKFCDSRNFSSKPMYVNLKYRKGSETFHSYFAQRRDDEWMMIELYQFLNQKEDFVHKFLLECLSPCYCGDDAIYIEGIEFRAIDNIKHGEIKRSKEAKQISTSNSDEDLGKQLQIKSEELVKRSKTYNSCEKVQNLQMYSLSEVNSKKHLMLSAKAVLCNFSDLKLFNAKSIKDSRFQDIIELLPQQTCSMNCTIKSQMLSRDTEYMCYLVFKLSENCQGLYCPVEVRDLLRQENKDAEFLYFISPSPWNIHDFTRVPEQRVDGWMEVMVRKFNPRELKNDRHVSLKLINLEGSMSGVIVCGLEFRPM